VTIRKIISKCAILYALSGTALAGGNVKHELANLAEELGQMKGTECLEARLIMEANILLAVVLLDAEDAGVTRYSIARYNQYTSPGMAHLLYTAQLNKIMLDYSGKTGKKGCPEHQMIKQRLDRFF